MKLHPAFVARPLAHRALHGPGRAENSLDAVRAAVAAGYGIEIDLQLSADGQAMVFHDATLDRLTAAHGPLSARNAAELADIALRGGGGTIPTLAQVLQAVAGRVPLLIELKDQTGTLSAGPDRLEQAAAAALTGYAGPVAVMSFNPQSVAAMARLAPDVARGLTTCAFADADWPAPTPDMAARRERLRAIADFGPVGASFISHDWRDLGAGAVTSLRAQGVPVLCWTIRSPQQEAIARLGADNITFEGYAPQA